VQLFLRTFGLRTSAQSHCLFFGHSVIQQTSLSHNTDLVPAILPAPVERASSKLLLSGRGRLGVTSSPTWRDSKDIGARVGLCKLQDLCVPRSKMEKGQCEYEVDIRRM
jgi:hypothetical protein